MIGPDQSPFGRQQLEILLLLVCDRDAEEVLRHEPGQVREQLRAIERKLKAQLAEPGSCAVIAEDISLGRRSSDIRDEIIAKVGMMADARTPEMQARYDAAVEREQHCTNQDRYCITISGPQGNSKLTIARAVLELLQEADMPCSMPEEVQNPFDGDSIEQLGHLRGVSPVVVQTVDDGTLHPSSQRLTFGELEPGDYFLGFPLPGDNSGHGGYLGAHRLFVKTRALTPPMYKDNGLASADGVESAFPNSMPVIKVQVEDDKPKSVTEFMRRAREASHDAFGLANDPETDAAWAKIRDPLDPTRKFSEGGGPEHRAALLIDCPTCRTKARQWCPIEGATWHLCGARIEAARGSTPAVRHWRNSGDTWFWSNDREDFGSVILEADRYVATTVRGSATFGSLADAKDFVEEHSS